MGIYDFNTGRMGDEPVGDCDGHVCPTCHGQGAGIEWDGTSRVQWTCVDCSGAGVVFDAGEEGEHAYLEAAE